MCSSRPIAVSLKARGLSVFDRPPLQGGLRRLGHHMAAETVDLGVSIATNVVLLTGSTWFSVVLQILSLCFYAFFQNGRVARDGFMLIPIAFLVYLPTLLLAYMTTCRRLQAARHLEAVQSQVLGMYVLHSSMSSCGAPQLLVQLDDAISDAMVQLQGYLAHPRALSARHISASILRAENLPTNSRLFLLGRDIGQRLRRLQRCLRRLAAAAAELLEHCSSPRSSGQHCTQQALALLQQLVALDASIAALVSLKELRSPLLLRCCLRVGCVLLAPLVTGSWLAGLAGAGLLRQRAGATGMVFAIVIGSILQVLLMSLLSLGLQLEDPFDTGPAAAPDTISLLEFNHTLSYLTAPPDAEDEPPADEDAVQEQQLPASVKYQQDIQGFVAQQQQHSVPAAAAPAATMQYAGSDFAHQTVFIQHYDDEQPIVPHESGSRSSQQAGGDAGPANMGYWHLADPVAASANRRRSCRVYSIMWCPSAANKLLL
ncbi:hypothetical protein OEZ85_000876 [Tetradesmus obliquus]|uniref:Uncharacterized protein n=1 Tax=Tetradesmus obliquus TaxID=3088 RepID=A0ABY8UKQ0_TETOB|nr:hypothetical protein OEZ85_000876 [Tetradesmus obliquus]